MRSRADGARLRRRPVDPTVPRTAVMRTADERRLFLSGAEPSCYAFFLRITRSAPMASRTRAIGSNPASAPVLASVCCAAAAFPLAMFAVVAVFSDAKKWSASRQAGWRHPWSRSPCRAVPVADPPACRLNGAVGAVGPVGPGCRAVARWCIRSRSFTRMGPGAGSVTRDQWREAASQFLRQVKTEVDTEIYRRVSSRTEAQIDGALKAPHFPRDPVLPRLTSTTPDRSGAVAVCSRCRCYYRGLTSTRGRVPSVPFP